MKNVLAVLVVALFAISISAQTKVTTPPAVKIPFAESLQAVVVQTKDWSATSGNAQIFERSGTRGSWKAVGEPFPIVVGRNGLGWAIESAPENLVNSAQTLRPTFVRYCSALANRNSNELRKLFSRSALADFERVMAEDGTTDLAEFVSVGVSSKGRICEIKNEQIKGNLAVAEVKMDEFPLGVRFLFSKENGEWKISNRAPAAMLKATGQLKKEGDGKAPAGMFPLTFAFGVSEKPEQLGFGYQKVEKFTECVDDPASSHYNKIVDRMKVGNFDWKSSEKMLEVGAEYSLGVFVAYNTFPVRSGDGSCIFLHVWKDSATPTSGCTAMDRRDLERIVSRLNPAKNPYLVQLPAAEYKKYRKSWNLPKMK